MFPGLGRVDLYFTAPSLVPHYVGAHRYQPPSLVIESIMAINLENEYDAELRYIEITTPESQLVERMRHEANLRAGLTLKSCYSAAQRTRFMRGDHLKYERWLLSRGYKI